MASVCGGSRVGGGAERPSLSLRLRYWSDAILIAAEEACDQPCPTRCPGHSDDECANGLACVVQADNYYEQCTNCTAESFERGALFGLNECSARSRADVHFSSSRELSHARTVVIVLVSVSPCEDTAKTCS